MCALCILFQDRFSTDVCPFAIYNVRANVKLSCPQLLQWLAVKVTCQLSSQTYMIYVTCAILTSPRPRCVICFNPCGNTTSTQAVLCAWNVPLPLTQIRQLRLCVCTVSAEVLQMMPCLTRFVSSCSGLEMCWHSLPHPKLTPTSCVGVLQMTPWLTRS